MTPQPPELQRWLPYRKPKSDPRARLFCFAHAGGAASVYRDWNEALPSQIEVCAVQLPGRESRLMEDPITRMDRLVETMTPALAPLFDRPTAFFGYSLGAAVAFETACFVSRKYGLRPAGLFVCARRAPHLPSHLGPVHLLPEAEFKDKLRALGGTPEEALNNAELFELISPVLRADFKLNDAYSSEPGSSALSCEVRAWGGYGDSEVSEADIDAWRTCTSGSFSMRMFEGSHFFLKQNLTAILKEVREALNGPASGGAG
jgi:medium-chain acyl-[acyl-carrier-protein] hydrolase